MRRSVTIARDWTFPEGSSIGMRGEPRQGGWGAITVAEKPVIMDSDHGFQQPWCTDGGAGGASLCMRETTTQANEAAVQKFSVLPRFVVFL